MNELTPERLAAIKDYCAKATAGPWTAELGEVLPEGITNRGIYARPTSHHVVEIIESPDTLHGECIHNESDWRFIANARTDLPLLVAEVERLKDHCKYLADGAETMRKAAEVASRLAMKSDAALSTAEKRIEELEKRVCEYFEWVKWAPHRRDCAGGCHSTTYMQDRYCSCGLTDLRGQSSPRHPTHPAMIRNVTRRKPGQYDRSHHPWRLSGKWRKPTTLSHQPVAVLSEPPVDAKQSTHINEG